MARTRRRCRTFALAWLVPVMLVPLAAHAQQQGANTGGPPAEMEGRGMLVLIGTYTNDKSGSKGVYALRMDPKTGALSEPQLAAEAKNPSFVALHPGGRFLYAANEVWEGGGKASGVAAFALDATADGAGTLSPLNAVATGGGPCYVAVHPSGRTVMSAQYGAGTVAALGIGDDGRLREPAQVIQHTSPTGPNARRQDKAHAHSINVDPSGTFAIACDLGTDEVLVYRLDAAGGKLTPNDPPAAKTAPGAGPRHLAFHPNGRVAYVINELNNTITAFAWDATGGTLREIGTVNSLPDDFTGNNTTAEVAVHPSGRFVYGSNRGHNSIAVFAVDEATGKLTARGHTSTQGKTPRHFAIDPSGTFLVAANQDTNNLVVFRIDPSTGALAPTGATATVGAPVCVRFVPGAR